jgi:hypothetical protein
MALLSLSAVLALMSWRQERNFFLEAWERVAGSTEVKAVQQKAASVRADAGPIRKCVVAGKTVYSNIDCGSDDPGSHEVDVHITEGVEAPKIPPNVKPQVRMPILPEENH